MSKGDWKRPIRDKRKFDDNWERIFGNREKRAHESQKPKGQIQ